MVDSLSLRSFSPLMVGWAKVRQWEHCAYKERTTKDRTIAYLVGQVCRLGRRQKSHQTAACARNRCCHC